MAKRWYYKDENGNKVPVPQYKINSDCIKLKIVLINQRANYEAHLLSQ